ncbi:aspartate-semialdehyde dehydrogenase [Lactovum miscens]|uniref:Aspartate-semialdehyde dehydrogenase n=1 Tax=Lactovum miscens TaxID=190387 RepID=A0A841C7V3_9LACT|nr:aspartate-semialdehyde dehydrogenase [Lactovum miscens]MBB5887320.1 aspartate-semialdehyde dehydrogenase [Lactovum miscens]
MNLAIVGATGLVGRTFIKIIEERNFPYEDLKLLASSRSAGKKVTVNDIEYMIEELNEHSFDDVDLALFSAGGEISKKFAPIAREHGATVVDNSSAWREDPTIGLVIPEINQGDASMNKIIANPNCSTIQSVLPLYALQKKYGLKQITYTTFQAVSGAGQRGVDDLRRTKNGEAPQYFPHNISKTAIPEIDVFLENGYTKEEMKMVNETRKILHQEDLAISATCVRVPVENSHGVSIQVTLEKDFTLEGVREAFQNQEGLVFVDDGPHHLYPTSELSNGVDDVFVGRLRKDLSRENSLLFYCTGDNIRKGAALNAVQIAEKLLKK